FVSLLAFRLANVFLVQTYIHPDETWQSLEVAHRSAFGYGFATWEWHYALRGFAHPMMFAAVYRALGWLRLDDTFLILAAPYALVALTAAAVDYATYHFAKRIAGCQVAPWALVCSLVSWTMASGIVRPLVNSAETALTAAAFVFWPWRRSGSRADRVAQSSSTIATGSSLPAALALAASSCIIRPTSGALWLCAGIVLLLRQPRTHRVARTAYIIRTALLIGAAALLIMLSIDRIWYGEWVFPPYNFYVFNVGEGLATWFGESSPFYHLFVSIPTLFTSMLPFVFHGIYVSYRDHCMSLDPAAVAVAASVVFSLVGHMEYRFLYPLLPIGFTYSAVSIHTSRWLTLRNVIVYLLVTNVPAALYLDLVHQRGVVDVMAHLRQRAVSGEVKSIGFLMPCHSTPFYSHLHKDIAMWFLTCEPPLEKSRLPTHYWEADEFEQNPDAFLDTIFRHLGNAHPLPGSPRPRPSHLVLYECMADRIHGHLAALGYGECARFFNTHFAGDSRREGDVLVY
ncbi:hypothetical protein GQ54DRAFT_251746, partial [Martensiomyces pterosporus]